MAKYDELKATVEKSLKGSSAPAPTLGGYKELEKYYDLDFSLPLSKAGASALAQQTGEEVEAAKRAAAAAAAAARAAQKAKKPTRERAPDGGWNFFDGDGNPISASQFAALMETDEATVLQGSNNPIDAQFTADYKNLEDFMNASFNGDTKALEAYKKANPALSNASPTDVLQKFRQAYPTVYGGNKPGQSFGSTFVPNLSVLRDSDTYGMGSLGGGWD